MSKLIEIKNAYYEGTITFEEAKKQLFEYASHPDAIAINNKSLAVWRDTKEYWDAQKWFDRLSIQAAVRHRNKHFPDLKINEMLTGEQIKSIYKAETNF